jgi:DNA-binding MarR family transcriptional regulator
LTFEEADTINQGIRVLSLRSRARAAALLSDLGLHPGQEVMLLELSRNGPLHQAQLSDRLSCEPPSITLMARKLEAAGYISRRQSKTDKRAVLVELTPAGRDLIEPIRRRWRILAEETIANLEKDAIAALPIILSQIGQSLGGW